MELDNLLNLLSNYSLASGQRINHQKSCIYFGKNIPQERRDQIKAKMGIEQEGGEGTYLGLPEAFGGSKVSILSYLKDRMRERVQGWQTRFLSSAGKEVMLKAVALALPTYTMACFLLPKTVCKKIVSIMSEFWWKNKLESRGIFRKSWDQMCKPKANGGLGFKDIEAFNLALLGKQLWRMLSVKDSLFTRVFKSRYFAKSDPLSAGLGSRPSYAWRSIHAAQKLIQQGARVLIGSGEDTKVFQDSWIGQQPARRAQVVRWNSRDSRQYLRHNLRVRELLINQGSEWNMELLTRIFPDDEARNISKIRTCGNGSKDIYIWDYNKKRHYKVKSGYWVQVNVLDRSAAVEIDQPSLDHLFQLAWSTETSPKVHHFLWRCISNLLPVAGNLARRHIAKEAGCLRCGCDTENVNHVLFQCPFARLVWALSPILAPPEGIIMNSLYSNIYHVLNIKKEYPREDIQAEIVPWILWRLWKNRNELLFKGKEFEAGSLILKAREDLEEWQGRCQGEITAAEKIEAKRATTSVQTLTWKPPPTDWLKCNSDGAWHQNRETSGLGWICRDASGHVLWAEARAVTKMDSSILTEAEALRWGAETLAGFGYKNVIFETDSLSLVKMINGNEEVWPVLQPTVEMIRHALLRIQSYEVRFYPRGGNKAADRIAKETITFVFNVPQLYSVVPLWLNYHVRSDKTVYTSNIG